MISVRTVRGAWVWINPRAIVAIHQKQRHLPATHGGMHPEVPAIYEVVLLTGLTYEVNTIGDLVI